MARYWDFPSQTWAPCAIVGHEKNLETGQYLSLTIRVHGVVLSVHPGSVQAEGTTSPVRCQEKAKGIYRHVYPGHATSPA